MPSTNYVFFTQRTAKTVNRIPLTPLQITRVLVEPQRITVTCTNGSKYVNSKPCQEEIAFWSKYRVPVEQTSLRWDMPSPDPLAMAALEEYIPSKELK
jgi:hypothetical protein